MRILRGAGDTELAAEMLNFEFGARVMGSDFKQLPAPHEPFPTLDIQPITKEGVPFQVHYRPALGVVYYVEPAGDSIQAQVERVATLLDSVGFQHLTSYRAVAATAAAVMRRKNRVLSKTILENYHDIALVSGSSDSVRPARLIFCCTAENVVPPCISSRAVFTWVFLPIAAVFKITMRANDDKTGEIVNASIAGIVHDGPGLLRKDTPSELLEITIEDFGKATDDQLANIARLQDICGTSTNGALLFSRGRFRFTKKQSTPWTAGRTITPSEEKWPNVLQCSVCDSPLNEVALILRGASQPTIRHHPIWYSADQPCKLNGGADIILCQDCQISTSCVSHMGGRVSSCRVPLSQIEICAQLPQYAPLVPVLEGIVSRIEGVPGAFLIRHASGDIIVIGGSRGKYPAIQYEVIARQNALVVPLLNIIEEIDDAPRLSSQ